MNYLYFSDSYNERTSSEGHPVCEDKESWQVCVRSATFTKHFKILFFLKSSHFTLNINDGLQS